MAGARHFNSSSSAANYRYGGSVQPITNHPVTFACWAYPLDTSVDDTLMYAGLLSGNQRYFQLAIRADGKVGFKARRSSTDPGFAVTSTTRTANRWIHCAGTYNGTTVQAFLNGGGKGTLSLTITLAYSIDRCALGQYAGLTAGEHYNGYMAHAAMWNAVLTDLEIYALAKNVSPMLVRTNNLRAYWPLLEDGTDVEARDFRGVAKMTKNGSGSIVAAPFGPRCAGHPLMGYAAFSRGI